MFEHEPNILNMNILFMFVFTTYSNRTSMCGFRFGPKTPEHELNRTVASLGTTARIAQKFPCLSFDISQLRLMELHQQYYTVKNLISGSLNAVSLHLYRLWRIQCLHQPVLSCKLTYVSPEVQFHSGGVQGWRRIWWFLNWLSRTEGLLFQLLCCLLFSNYFPLQYI